VGTTRRSRGFKRFKYIWKGKFSYLNDDFDAKLMNLQEKAPCAMCSVQGRRLPLISQNFCTR